MASTVGSTSRHPTRTPSPKPVTTSSTRPTPCRATCSSTRWPPDRSWSSGWAVRPEPVVVNYHSSRRPSTSLLGTTGSPATRPRPPSNSATWRKRLALGIGVSEFDAGELRAGGYRDVVVIPIANVRMPPIPPDPAAVAALARRAGTGPGGCRWAAWPPTRPIRTPSPPCSWPGSTTSPDARLTIVGSPSEPSYARALHRYADRLGSGRCRSTSCPAIATPNCRPTTPRPTSW